MNLKYFIIAFATFISVTVAQGASLVTSQKLVQGISSVVSSKSFLESLQLSNPLAEAFQRKFSGIDSEQEKAAVKFVPVLSSPKRRGSRFSGKRTRTNLFLRSPMSF
ncbi:hypothetical protein [Bartonella sp. CB169]|uniref:hypothetical protein n=1 Tax=Bartonella sp. CB169 TaxID=3112257 RepID=UPI00300E2FB5